MGGTSPPNPNDSHGPTSSNSPAGAAGARGVEVVRSEERLRFRTDVKVSGRALLRKYIVTETVTQTFQVRHEAVRVEHKPLTDAGAFFPTPVSL